MPGLKSRLLIAARRAAIPLRDTLRQRGLLGGMDVRLARLSRRLVKPIEHETVAELPGNVKLCVPAGIVSGRALIDGSFEAEVTAALREAMSPGATFVDVGANIGYYTVIAASIVGPGGRVFAFEPDPEAFRSLTRSVAANGFENVVATEAAVSDEPGVALLRRAQLEFSSIVLDLATDDTVEVPVVSLDGFFDEAGGDVHVVKMDVEGAEYRALAGMRRLAERNPGMRLVVEWNPIAINGSGITEKQMAARLVEVGFRLGEILERRKPIDLATELPPKGALYNLALTASA